MRKVGQPERSSAQMIDIFILSLVSVFVFKSHESI